MTNKTLPAELERRLTELEKPENQGAGLSLADWVFLLVAGLLGPVILLFWGW